MIYFPIQTQPTQAHKKDPVTMARTTGPAYSFPVSNSLTPSDERYFEMIQKEANWGQEGENITYIEKPKEENIKVVHQQTIDRHGAPDSNSLTETDREYFNIIKTEDGLSQFFKNQRDTESNVPLKRLNASANRNIYKESERISDTSGDISNNKLVSEKHPSFRFHIVSPDKSNKNKKPIVGLYLGPNDS